MFSWNFAKSAEAMFSRLAIKKICKFLLKKKLGQLILGDIDLNQLDVQLSNGTIQLSDLAINVDFINQKFGEASILVLKEGSIGSLTVKLPWKGRNCEIEVEELEIVLALGGNKNSQFENKPSTSGQDTNSYTSHEYTTPDREISDSTIVTPVDIHEGVKTIAKMVKWLLTSFHVKIKKLIVALEPSQKDHGRTLVLRFGEVECGTGISDDINLEHHSTVDGFLGLSRLTNFVKFDNAVLEFLDINSDKNEKESVFPHAVVIGENGGFSGTIKLSIPWKNGSLDIRKLDAEVYIDPLELRLQPSTIKSFMYFVNVFEELDKGYKNSKVAESVYYNASSHGYLSRSSSFEFSSNDKTLQKPEMFSNESKDTVFDALLRGSHLISDWMTSPIASDQDQETEEPDFGASVDQFFECFDELRSSQSALGNSGMWNWTCSVFSAITAASNLASGSLQIPSEQKHVETSLKAKITQIIILFSFVDEEQNYSKVHYINADFHEMQLVLQVSPRESNFEATVNHIEVSDHFSNEHYSSDMNTQTSLIRNKQSAVEDACPPFEYQDQIHASKNPRNHRSSNVVKVLLFKTYDITQFQYIINSQSHSNSHSFSLKFPPIIFWINFNLITEILNLITEIDNEVKSYNKNEICESRVDISKSSKETLRFNISLMDARIILCFPFENIEDYKKTYVLWNNFIVFDINSPLGLTESKFPVLKDRFRLVPSRAVHVSVGDMSVYLVGSSENENKFEFKFHADRVVSVLSKTGNPSVISLLQQDNAVTGPWITKRAKTLAVSDGTTSRNKSTGIGNGLSFVTTTKDMEDFNNRTQEELISSSSSFLHLHLSPVTIDLSPSLHQTLNNHINQINVWISSNSSDQVNDRSQLSILIECDQVSISIELTPLDDIKSSIQNELSGSWCKLKLKVDKFEMLTVSNTGGVSGASFLWVAHREGALTGSITGVNTEFVLIACDNSSRGRGNGEGSNILASRLPGSDIIHMWDPQNRISHVSINIRCATIVAVGGRLDWFESITSLFSQKSKSKSTEVLEDSGKDTSESSFVLNLIDIGLSYEPYFEKDSKSDIFGGILAASSLKVTNFIKNDYEIKGHDVGLLLCEESGVQNLLKRRYVKVGEETHVELTLRTNCENGHNWEVECLESHIVLETCQDSAFGLSRIGNQLQQIFAPDVEESIVHLQSRWDNVQLAQSRSVSNHSSSSSSDLNTEAYSVNLMDEISEGAFNTVKTQVPILGFEDYEFETETSCSNISIPEFIDGYFLSDTKVNPRGKSANMKEPEGKVGNGWYGDSLFKIVEDHVLGVGDKTNSKAVDNEGFVIGNNVKGRVVLKNIDLRCVLYGGSDFQYTRNKDVGLEISLSKIGFHCDVFPDGEICVSKVSVSVGDFSVNDVSKNAPWIQVLGCYQTKDRPRESRSSALKLDLESVRPHPSIPLEEYRLQIALLPIRLHLHQSQLEFLITFFGGKTSSSDNSHDLNDSDAPQKNADNLGSHSIIEEALLPYFQKFSISPVVIRVDYIPSRVDLTALGHGKYVELVNLFQWKGVELKLKRVQAVGVYGWSSVCETIIGEWLEDISQNQVHKLLKGLPPIRSLVAVGSSAAKLVSLPVKNYKKDRRIVKGVQRGTIAFLRSVSLEAIGFGAHIAAGAHAILLQAEEIISTTPPTSVPRPIQTRVNPNSRSGQPKDARQGMQQAIETISDGFGKSASALVQTPFKKFQRGAGVGSALSTAVQAAPGAAIAPASAAARAVHSALLGVRNSLDPEHKKDSMDKYLGRTQSQSR